MDTESQTNDARERLRSISRALQDLHRVLLAYQRREYEKFFGRIGSDFYVLQLAAEDPQFAWLRALAAEMMRIDTLVSGKEEIDLAELQLTGSRLRYLLSPTSDGNSFQSHYDRAMQTTPEVIMAHAAAMRSLPPARDARLFRGVSTADLPAGSAFPGRDVRLHYPGTLVPGHEDHGYRALAVVAEIAPTTGSHSVAYRNEDVITWVPEGAVRFEGSGGEKVTADPSRMMVVNAGTGVEYTVTADGAARLYQAFVRPSAIGQEPREQAGSMPEPGQGAWRSLVGPEGEDAPFEVRNQVAMSDIALDAGDRVPVPAREGWDTFFLVTEGLVDVDGVRFRVGESGLVLAPEDVVIAASERARILAFLVDSRAKVTRAGRTAR